MGVLVVLLTGAKKVKVVHLRVNVQLLHRYLFKSTALFKETGYNNSEGRWCME